MPDTVRVARSRTGPVREFMPPLWHSGAGGASCPSFLMGWPRWLKRGRPLVGPKPRPWHEKGRPWFWRRLVPLATWPAPVAWRESALCFGLCRPFLPKRWLLWRRRGPALVLPRPAHQAPSQSYVLLLLYVWYIGQPPMRYTTNSQ